MKNTENYGFNLPEGGDFYSVEHSNENFIAIDKELKKFADGTQQVGNAKQLDGHGADYFAKAEETTNAINELKEDMQELTSSEHTHTIEDITDFPATMAPSAHSHTKSEISDFPSSMPASDVPSWAKESSKPKYTASEVGLGNVPNVATDDQTPSFSTASERANIVSKEKLSIMLGKIAKFFTDLKAVAFSGSYNDLSNKPTIPTAVAVKGNAESSYRTGNVNLTPANIGASATGHSHSASNITSGILPIARGGTGCSTGAELSEMIKELGGGAETETGTFTLKMNGVTLGTGTFCKVGKMVHCQVTGNFPQGFEAGYPELSGLPFSIKGGNTNYFEFHAHQQYGKSGDNIVFAVSGSTITLYTTSTLNKSQPFTFTAMYVTE